MPMVVDDVVVAETTVGTMPSVATTPPTTIVSVSKPFVSVIFPFSAYVTVGVASVSNAEARVNVIVFVPST